MPNFRKQEAEMNFCVYKKMLMSKDEKIEKTFM